MARGVSTKSRITCAICTRKKKRRRGNVLSAQLDHSNQKKRRRSVKEKGGEKKNIYTFPRARYGGASSWCHIAHDSLGRNNIKAETKGGWNPQHSAGEGNSTLVYAREKRRGLWRGQRPHWPDGLELLRTSARWPCMAGLGSCEMRTKREKEVNLTRTGEKIPPVTKKVAWGRPKK